MEITTETIKQNYPAIWWQIYRAGFSAAVNDPNQQERAAKKHMEQALTKASPAAQAARCAAARYHSGRGFRPDLGREVAPSPQR